MRAKESKNILVALEMNPSLPPLGEQINQAACLTCARE